MEDCMAMYVDVVTYLFNFLAERFKHGGFHRSSSSSSCSMKARDIRLYRLYLELIPPFISVTTLVAVTVLALRDAIDTLIIIKEPPTAQEDQPDLAIMLVFSGMNLLLDFVNVAFFAKAHQAVGLTGSHTIMESVRGGYPDEHTALLVSSCSLTLAHSGGHQIVDTTLTENAPSADDNDNDDDDREDAMSDDTEVEGGLNLNMCSAWTHVCADTLRSIAVLVAAGFAYVFPSLLSAANADAWGAIVVSIIILVSLGPLLQGIYLTGVKIYRTWYELDHHCRLDSNSNSSSSSSNKPSDIVLTV